ncbi:hypothetical protein PTRG_01952 [Pyrenophora tritici-repentis Pt-1C-BFP]|uniref:Uncharacterized protein n=1 Tax=Pyrenophora tritici-repentis (strain Pt-1C-BFP) TaxID=426418 RepID=B2VTI8_PYRTR|nr:uncharacterized protein PTRG_01952 [Pyrenophora tritici-repentis Pt-1C-BFP]EDU41390.1 hypothetical protein PTRG_01952 [Pyrenophora tritici-repentis Pt-1C-BFP]
MRSSRAMRLMVQRTAHIPLVCHMRQRNLGTKDVCSRPHTLLMVLLLVQSWALVARHGTQRRHSTFQ